MRRDRVSFFQQPDKAGSRSGRSAPLVQWCIPISCYHYSSAVRASAERQPSAHRASAKRFEQKNGGLAETGLCARKRAPDPVDMTATKPGLKSLVKTVRRGPERSALYHYLFEHHDRFKRASEGSRIPWSDLAAGLGREVGERVTEATARHTWTRVRAAVEKKRKAKAEAEAARKLREPSSMPSRFPPDLRPVEYTRPAAVPPPPSLPKPAEPNAPASPTDRTPAEARADAQIERMRRIIAERSGRKYPS